MLYCQACQTPNPEHHKFCQKCRTPLVRRYLWATANPSLPTDLPFKPGELIADRYAYKGSQLFLDTRPGQFDTHFVEIPPDYAYYLRLSPYQLHLPQIYDWFALDSGGHLFFLDEPPLLPAAEGETPALAPSLAAAWRTAAPLRQLNWLWQIANLWHPLESEAALATLFQPDHLRVEGGLLRLLELSPDRRDDVKVLSDLGDAWQPLAKTADPQIADFLQDLCHSLQSGAIYNAEQLSTALDEAIAQVASRQTRQIQIATRSDAGPTRSSNEDACYPISGTVEILETDGGFTHGLVVVCDGIGGHEGGEVASGLAIASITERVHYLDLAHLDPVALTLELEKAVCAANDEISQRNDAEQRSERQRMGTTVVMGLIRQHELYLMHVGDSRAYCITRQSCRQITVDDDVASRQVRLGYNTYRQALQQPGSGSLVQALGMGDSSLLYPTVQRFILDEDSLFLICSDGLSDSDRVEEHWESEMLPLLNQDITLEALSERLIDLANTTNGHDNATIGLIHCQVEDTAKPTQLPRLVESKPVATMAVSGLSRAAASAATSRGTATIPRSPAAVPAIATLNSEVKTQVFQAPSKRSPVALWVGLAIALGLGGALTYLLWSNNRNPVGEPIVGVFPSPVVPPAPPKPPASPLEVSTFVQVIKPTVAETPTPSSPGSPTTGTLPGSAPLYLKPDPEAPAPQSSPVTATKDPTSITEERRLPVGTILKIQGKNNDRWLKVQVCSIDPKTRVLAPANSATNAASPTRSSAVPDFAVVESGQTGWIRETLLQPSVRLRPQISTEEQGSCAAPANTDAPNSDSTSSDSTSSDSTNPDATDSGVTNSGVTNSDVTNSDATDPDASGSNTNSLESAPKPDN
jgi:protein phosphatase